MVTSPQHRGQDAEPTQIRLNHETPIVRDTERQTMSAAGITAKAGQDQFLQLMVAQLKSQDPLEPMKDQEFIGQLAQFSTLEGIEKLNANFTDMLALQQITQGANLIGQEIVYRDENNQTTQGTVRGFAVNEGRVELQVGEELVTLDDVIGMYSAAA